MTNPSGQWHGGNYDYTCGIACRPGSIRPMMFWPSVPSRVQDGYDPVVRWIVESDANAPIPIGVGFTFAPDPAALVSEPGGDPSLTTYVGEIDLFLGSRSNPLLVAAAPGVTVTPETGKTLALLTPFNFVTLRKTGDNTWSLSGDLKPS
ncbi:hypothetical protein [Bradyrhizobium sp. AZCC 2289]|uniref:hypothetical protein n=1 Tax=Bradyrhizobium sp. AZCC 2289 TaxID=3117026 RepID=UPI002FEF17A9